MPGTEPDGSLVAGVDGAPGGWMVAVARVEPFEILSVSFERSVRSVLGAGAPGGDVNFGIVVIDMPIGMPERGRRPCEESARTALGARRSSIFWTPPRGVLDHVDDYAAANARCRELSGKGLSRQSFGLLTKVAELDGALEDVGARRTEDVWEGHPELAFTRLRGAPMRHSKRTAAGVAERLSVLESVAIDWRRWLADPPGGFGEDVIDCLVLAETAATLSAGRPMTVHGDGSRDGRGRPLRITG